MSWWWRIRRGHATTFAAAALLFGLAGACFRDGAPANGAAVLPPSRVENAVAESDLATVLLTAKAVERLGIETAEVTATSLPRSRRYTGVIVVRPGGEVTILAPIAGTVLAPEGGVLPTPGARVRSGQVVLRLMPLASDTDIIRAEAEAAARLEAARRQAERASRLLEARAGSAKDEERARTELKIAETNHRSIRTQLAQLGVASGGGAAVALTSPLDGRLADLSAVAEQLVVQGAGLFRVVDDDPLWLRVPVYVGDVDRVDLAAAAEARALGGNPNMAALAALPVIAPPTADPAAATVDLYYRLASSEVELRPGQRLEVDLPLETSGEELVVPRSAVVYDMHGGAWVYEQRGPGEFVRRRVEIAFTKGEWLALQRGPAAGTAVVCEGVAELFGSEFGAGK